MTHHNLEYKGKPLKEKQDETLELIRRMREELDTNGYAFFDEEAFKEQGSRICYIPENAETEKDMYSYEKILNEVKEWAEQNTDFMIEHGLTPTKLAENVFYGSKESGVFPSTYLADLDND